MSKGGTEQTEAASRLIDERISELGDWRGAVLSRLRTLIRQADPEVVEEWKWKVPVWSHGGLICTGETYKTAVKMTFPKGAALADPAGLFNSSLEGQTRRAIDVREGDEIDEEALKALIRAAVALNTARSPGLKREIPGAGAMSATRRGNAPPRFIRKLAACFILTAMTLPPPPSPKRSPFTRWLLEEAAPQPKPEGFYEQEQTARAQQPYAPLVAGDVSDGGGLLLARWAISRASRRWQPGHCRHSRRWCWCW